MDIDSDLIGLLKNNYADFSEEEIKKILENENSKSEDERNSELIDCCINALESKKASGKQVKKKSSYAKFIFIAVAAALLILVNVVMFSKTTEASSDVTLPSSTTAETGDTTVTSTDKTSETTEVITAENTDITADFFKSAENAVFYYNSKSQNVAEDMLNKNILKIINGEIGGKTFGILKLVVTEQFIEKIKAENMCLEISFNSVQRISGLKGTENKTFEFEKVLIALDGENKNVIFFMKDGKYQNGPVKLFDSTLCEDILDYIQIK